MTLQAFLGQCCCCATLTFRRGFFCRTTGLSSFCECDRIQDVVTDCSEATVIVVCAHAVEAKFIIEEAESLDDPYAVGHIDAPLVQLHTGLFGMI